MIHIEAFGTNPLARQTLRVNDPSSRVRITRDALWSIVVALVLEELELCDFASSTLVTYLHAVEREPSRFGTCATPWQTETVAEVLGKPDMLIHVYCDESSDERCERVFAVSGLLGTDDECASTEAAWMAATGGEEFHAAPWEHAGRHEDFDALVRVLERGEIAGFCVSLDLVSLAASFPGRDPNWHYYKCVHDLLQILAICGQKLAATDEGIATEPHRIRLTLDGRAQSNANTKRLQQFFATQPEWREQTVFDGPPQFGTRL